MLIGFVLSIFSSTLLLSSQLRMLLVQLMRGELPLVFSGRVVIMMSSTNILNLVLENLEIIIDNGSK